ncbi:hypothetical protein [Halobacillus sp. A5]|uniref:hypothetical protein n=1 Tax=Halobacillus sp. A5 TaxID=2880263 RepID=UPI0020A6C801|nr:hypothetical protein [Halobacillus sp. A5]MCP3025400.1 hypothetical protein [Halobacillus sp. A5]
MKNVKGIRLYNVLVEENSEFKLSVDELYLYSILRRLNNFNLETVISMDGIEQYSRNFNDIKFYSKLQEARKRVKSCLLNLLDKGVVQVDSEPKNYDQLLKITFVENLGGYEYIPFDTFDSMNRMVHNYIYFVVSKWKGTKDGSFHCSKSRWADILNVNPKTADKYVNECVEDGLIFKNVGDYSNAEARNGQMKQDSNQYKIVPFTDEEKSNMQKKEEKENTLDLDAGVDDSWGESNKFPFDTGNWLSKGNLTEDDYEIYILHLDDQDFISECDKKRKRILNSKKGEWFKNSIDKPYMEQAKECLERKENGKREKQATDIVHNTDDVALLVQGRIIPHAEWNQSDKIDEIYYLYGERDSASPDGVGWSIRKVSLMDNEDVEMYRPDEKGEWDSDVKQVERDMQYEDERVIGLPSDLEKYY